MLVALLDTVATIFDALLLCAQAALIGGAVFVLLAARPLGTEPLLRRSLAWVQLSAGAVIVAEALSAASPLADLVGDMGLGLGEALSAPFAMWHGLGALSALAAGVLTRTPLARRRPAILLPPLVALVITGVMTSHAVSRIDGRAALSLAYFVHVTAASVWIGGIPYLLMAIRTLAGTPACRRIVRRFSAVAAPSVAVLLLSAAWLARVNVGSVAALIGSQYGALVLAKIGFLGCLLLLGLGNLRAGRRIERDGAKALRRIGGFAETELAVAAVVLVAAASLTAQPPPVDTPGDLVSAAQLWGRIEPRWPMLWDPPMVTSAAWSTVNHNVSGVLVLIIGLLALSHRAGWAPARHWPLLLAGFAGIALRSDTDCWPWGPCGFFGCGGGDPEVIQHRLLTLIPVGFGIMEWTLRTGRWKRPGMTYAFPLFCTAGAALLLTHSHNISDIRQLYLVEFSHVGMAFFGALAGAGRWLELRGDAVARRWAGWFWPLCFILVGLILADYRE
ncbi:MAG: CopD family protein [Magnetospirillum sp.]|nr:CopD family protein [Magnetospirillum sp.]